MHIVSSQYVSVAIYCTVVITKSLIGATKIALP
jgi:hypothetical protein